MAPKVSAAPMREDHAVEYAYLQIDEYASKKHKGLTLGAKRWVPLPRGTHVHTHSCNDNSMLKDERRRVPYHPMRSCMKQTQVSACSKMILDLDSFDTVSTASTVASSSAERHVRFRDGFSPGSLQEARADEMDCQDSTDIGDERMVPLADWIFIDRDICGFSLYEFAPDDPEIMDFASSPYSCMFFQELADVEYVNSWEQRFAAACQQNKDQYRHEERQLDKALLSAGVHVNYLHAAPDTEESSEIVQRLVSL